MSYRSHDRTRGRIKFAATVTLLATVALGLVNNSVNLVVFGVFLSLLVLSTLFLVDD